MSYREYICYKCHCEKCGKDWITKDHKLPSVCANKACKRKDWNSQPGLDIVDPISAPSPVTEESLSPITNDTPKGEDLSHLSEAELMDLIRQEEEEELWIEQPGIFENNEWVTYERHIKSGEKRLVRTEPNDWAA